MDNTFEILPLRTIEQEAIRTIVKGYVSHEKYAVDKSESDAQTVFNIRLVKLETPHQASFIEDFNDEDCKRFLGYLPQGYSFGAYHSGKLVAFAISEATFWSRSVRIWEFHVMPEFHHQGIGRALMNHVVDKIAQDNFRIVFLETQNTNVSAIRFYRKMGYCLDALDLSYYTNQDVEAGEVAFFMKRKLD